MQRVQIPKARGSLLSLRPRRVDEKQKGYVDLAEGPQDNTNVPRHARAPRGMLGWAPFTGVKAHQNGLPYKSAGRHWVHSLALVHL